MQASSSCWRTRRWWWAAATTPTPHRCAPAAHVLHAATHASQGAGLPCEQVTPCIGAPRAFSLPRREPHSLPRALPVCCRTCTMPSRAASTPSGACSSRPWTPRQGPGRRSRPSRAKRRLCGVARRPRGKAVPGGFAPWQGRPSCASRHAWEPCESKMCTWVPPPPCRSLPADAGQLRL